MPDAHDRTTSPDALDLVQLSALPASTWPGRLVFHPHEQRGDTPFWKPTDPDEPDETRYDLGTVLTHFPDPDFPDEAPRVRFALAGGGTLQYAATNLWTPRTP